MKVMSEKEQLGVQLKELRRVHRALDAEIAAMAEDRSADPLTLKRLKKKKLALKDRIGRVEDQLYPDIIA